MKKGDLLVKLDEITRLVETLVVENASLDKKVKNLEVRICDFMPSLQLKVRKCVKTQELFRPPN